MKFYRIRQKSDRKKLRDEIGKLHLKILKIERGDICEIHNRKCSNIGRSHILSVGLYPKLEFYSENIVLAGWYCSHFYSHHNPDDPRAELMKQRTIELRGEDCKDRLKVLNVGAPKLTMSSLQMIYAAYKQAVEDLDETS